MRRMYDGVGVKIPSKDNLVYCTQFIADSVVVNNVAPNYYCVKLIDTDGDNVECALDYFDFKYDSTYGTIVGHYFYNANMAQIMALQGEYSANSQTITFTLIDTVGNTIQSPRSIHIDIFKIGE